MATEFKLSFTGSEVNEKLGKIDGLVNAETRLTNEIAVERARINSFTALGEGSTTGDAELQDIRTGFDGTVYETAGEAVRGQVKAAINSTSNLEDDICEAIGSTIVEETKVVTEKSYYEAVIGYWHAWNGSDGTGTTRVSTMACTQIPIVASADMKKVSVPDDYCVHKIYGSMTEYTDLVPLLVNVAPAQEMDIPENSYKYYYVDLCHSVNGTPIPTDQNFSKAVCIISERTVTQTVKKFRGIGSDVGNLEDLSTDGKTSLVLAINEIHNDAVSGGVIGYDTVAEEERAVPVSNITVRKWYCGYFEYGTANPPTTNAARACFVFTKAKNDIGIRTFGDYRIASVFVQYDSGDVTNIFSEVSVMADYFDISEVPAGSTIYVDLYKVVENQFVQFAENEDMTNAVKIVSNSVKPRNISQIVTAPSEIVATMLLNQRVNKKKLKIKLLGDSITHGMGSSDYNGIYDYNGAQTDDVITLSNGMKWLRNSGSKCWANMFKAYFQSKFDSDVINNGCSGINSTNILDSWDILVDGDEDLIICMIGTNDRMAFNNTDLKNEFYARLEEIIRNAKLANIPIIMMSCIPVSLWYELRTGDDVEHTFYMHAEDIDNIVHLVCQKYGIGYVSMFNEFLNHCDCRGIEFDSLLADKLHPNDNGHALMYKIFMRSLGLGRKIDGATW